MSDKRYIRRPELDRRIGRGDDFAGDAWEDTETGGILYTAVGVDRNASAPRGGGEYMAETFLYGGLLCTRAAIIADLQRIGGTRQQIDRYLQGLELRKRLDEGRGNRG